MSLAQHPHCAAAHQYALDVIEGRQLACHWVIRACQRHIDDLQRAKDEPDHFRFNMKEGDRACKIIEKLPHVKGRWAKRGETLKLEPWQQFILTNVFGWQIWDEDADGWVRRFRTVYESVARKNAKSTIANGMALVAGFTEGEAGAEVYSAATGRDQAGYTFGIGKAMVDQCAGFRERFNVGSFAHNVHSLETGSQYMAISAEQKQLDGKSPHFALIDEFHAHKTPAVRDSLKTGMGSREQPIECIVTTAGNMLDGPCYAFESHAKKVLDGVVEDDSLFAIIFTLDTVDLMDEGEGSGDRWDDPKVWVKANPNLGVSIFARDLKARCGEAKSDAIQQTSFKTKRLNMWVTASVRWMNMQEWVACGEPFDIADLKGVSAFIGLDLATRDDIAARMLVWERGGHFYAKGKYFLPEEQVLEKAASTHAHYAGWAAEGRLTLTPGNVIDQKAIEEEILGLPAHGIQLREVCFDPFQAVNMAQNLQRQGLAAIEIKPTVANFSETMKDLGALVKSRKFHHGGCPILTWMVSNVTAHFDQKDNIYPRKERPEAKIDGIIGILMAMRRMLVREVPQPSRYENPEAEVIVV